MKPHYLYLKTLLLLLLLAGTVVTASAYDFYKDGIYYNRTSSSTVEVTGDFEEDSPCIAIDETNYSGRVDIPRQVTYNGVTYTVDAIGAHAFKNSGISYLVIPSTVEYIDYHAFEGCGFSSIECYSTEPGIMSTWGWGVDYSAGSADCLYVLPGVLSDFQDSYRWQGYCRNIMALDVVMINSTNFPDANFRNYLLSLYPDGYLTQYDIANMTSLNVSNKGISNMKGIEYFTALKELRCWANSFTSLNLNSNTELTYLDCAPNSSLTTLNVSNCSKLQTVYCYSTALTGLTITGKPNLTRLDCHNCTSLKFIYCYNDNLTTLNVTGCTALERLDCYYNYNLAEITGLGDCTAITYLDCEDCAITDLSAVNSMTNLEKLYCRNNKISTLTLNYKPNLSFVRVSGNPNLTTLRCSGNSQLSSVYMYNCPALESAWINMNNLSSLDLSGCTSLNNLSIWQNHISGNNMTNLVYSLPTVPGSIPGEIAVLDNVDEGNVITDAQVLTAKRKNWVCLRWTGSTWARIDVPMPGDVDGDGVVNIADVTALIDILLSGGTVPANADVDGDGVVNIADVTALIDMLLSGNAKGA
jgi:hypothetical protein